MTRKCSSCKEMKPLEQFHVANKNPLGRGHICKPCKAKYQKWWNHVHKLRGNAYSKEWRDKHKELALQRVKAVRVARKYQALSHYSGGEPICKCCAEVGICFLTIDHINNDGAQHRRENKTARRRIYDFCILNNFPSGFQVLCFNCNLGKQLNKGICPHQNTPSNK